ncbi:acyl-CoA dehydrogenase [Desulfatibacillum aliphaticivorans]|uniref:acyl-CoA dehydrogenase n=1 Tax=Desulfatibacillum aliphaticivorans TaxID=218208 RepID=UPI0004001C6A|nr:acyl-CoA dehydrogenase [Desulfatibacillum aliphaticivorans]
MAAKFASEKNVKFMLYEVHDLMSLTKLEYYSMHNKKAFDMILDAGMQMAKDMYYPIFKEMDEVHPELADGTVKVHADVKKIMKEAGEGGWISATFPIEFDGGQLPTMLNCATHHMFGAANYSGSVYPGLTSGAAKLITSFGDKELIDTYVPNMLDGKWQGTMALTEPQAGSSLADITTTAYPQEDGSYKIKGQKVFISAGDHDGVENIVHLMLAKIEGAPPGVKGISLFVAPKYRPTADGKLEYNDIAVSQVFHKMGYRGAPITELAIGDKGECVGWLVGKPHHGLKYMFQMMNGARLDVGNAATSIACAAYYASLDYAKQRPQGRRLGQKDLSKPQVSIIEHADVKRMLLQQKAIVEGSLSLILQCHKYEDLETAAADPEEAEKYNLLCEILTPIAKTYPSEMGIISTSNAIQCLGGYGYCQDFPVEQYYRDIRIHPIHEGTTGIQGMDLLGRKVVMLEGKAFKLFKEEMEKTLVMAEESDVYKEYAGLLRDALADIEEVTAHKMKVAATKGAEAFLADACLYLEMFGYMTIGWQWLLQALMAQKGLDGGKAKKMKDLYEGKIITCKYFFKYELIKAKALKIRLMEDDYLTAEAPASCFND